jgi:hypothetical protein
MAPYSVIIHCDILCELPEQHGARGDVYAEDHSIANGDHLFGKL